MLQITRAAAAMTKVTRKALKNVEKGKINLATASDSFNKFYDKSVKDLKYSKNIFKRAVQWVKDFIAQYKKVKDSINEMISIQKEELGANFTKKDKKEAKTFVTETIRDVIKKQRAELKELIKAAKAPKK